MGIWDFVVLSLINTGLLTLTVTGLLWKNGLCGLQSRCRDVFKVLSLFLGREEEERRQSNCFMALRQAMINLIYTVLPISGEVRKEGRKVGLFNSKAHI